jgi:hypothetical protein
MMPGPHVGAVENLAEYVVLTLIAGGVAPTDGRRLSVTFEVGRLPLGLGRVTVDVVQHPGPAVALELPEHPVQKAARLVGEADAIECINGERGIADPDVAIVPVAAAADRLW